MTTCSIITPSFKQLDWLRLCVASVQDQVEPPSPESAIRYPLSAISTLRVEHIIQDAGSPGIEDFAREVGADFYRDGTLISHSTLRIPNYSLAIYSERDEGMYDAINRGLRRSSGDICAYLNCDEQYLPGALRSVLEYFRKRPKKAMVFADALLLDTNGNALSYRRTVIPDRLHTRLCHLNTLTCSTFFRRTIVDQGFYFSADKKSIGDAVWVDSILAAGISMGYMKIVTSTFSFTGVNMSELDKGDGSEQSLWLSEAGAPSLFLRKPVSVLHRLKKLLAGAYRKRSVDYAIYSAGYINARKCFHVTRIGSGWPGQTL